MKIRQLTQSDIPELLQTINGAFKDYIVPFQLDIEQLRQKISMEDIQLTWSVAVFAENKLVAFMMHGLREIDRQLVVYNGGTGVLPEFRGHGLVGKMYHYLIPFFNENKVRRIVLEAIESNEAAIRAYMKNGFSINRQLLCFSGIIQPDTLSNVARIQPLSNFSWQQFQSFWNILPSWQSAVQSMERLQPQALGAYIDEKLVGYMLFNPDNKRIYQVAVAPEYRRKGIGTQLFHTLEKEMPAEKISLNNVDAKAKEVKLFLEKQGLVNGINQVEMIKLL